jgi:hypothetical protein
MTLLFLLLTEVKQEAEEEIRGGGEEGDGVLSALERVALQPASLSLLFIRWLVHCWMFS